MSESSNPPVDDSTTASPREREVLRVSTSSLRVPRGLEERETAGTADRVVAVIFLLALAFIAIVAWLIHGGQ